MNDVAERGKAFKTTTARDDTVTAQYRRGLLNRAERQWKETDPVKYNSMRERIFKMDADHMHELQLGGIDHASALTMLDRSVNRSFGAQIRPQLAKMPEGTQITKVVEKGTN